MSRKNTEWKARQRRLVAVHEAGHVVITQRFGYPCEAWIGPDDGERGWHGWARAKRIRYVRHGGSIWQEVLPELTQRQKRLINVAGAVAEFCWDDWCDPWECFETMSESDRELGGFPPDEPDEVYYAAFRAVWKLLNRDTGPLWPSLIKTARSLIVDQGLSLVLANSMEQAAEHKPSRSRRVFRQRVPA